jgi:hypothetical protein
VLARVRASPNTVTHPNRGMRPVASDPSDPLRIGLRGVAA